MGGVSVIFEILSTLAQLAELWTTVQEVAGSNPGGTNTQGV